MFSLPDSRSGVSTSNEGNVQKVPAGLLLGALSRTLWVRNYSFSFPEWPNLQLESREEGTPVFQSDTFSGSMIYGAHSVDREIGLAEPM